MVQQNCVLGFKPLLLVSTIFACMGCQKSIADPKTIASPAVVVPAIPKFDRAAEIEIHRDWNGYSDITPILRRYKFKQVNRQLVGSAHTALGGYGAAGIRQQVTKKIAIPTPISQKFLTTLSTTPLAVGAYQPILTRKDDYPSIGVKITIDRQQITFNSTSQGVGHKPWQISIVDRGITRKYISNSDTPDRALKLLSPYLDREGIDKIIQKRRK
jgi:hypothetical protein